MTDGQILVDEKAGIVIAEHIEPGASARSGDRSPIAMPDTQEVVEVVKKLKAKSWLTVVKSRPGVR